jgi:hypothetical protein
MAVSTPYRSTGRHQPWWRGTWWSAMWRRFLGHEAGTLAVELAMSVPVVFALMVAGVEVTRYVLLNQKVERTSATMADLVAQSEALSEAALLNLVGAARHVMTPYPVDSDGRIVVSSLTNPTGSEPRVVWQRGYGGGSGGSHFGVQGGVAQLPQDFVVRSDENVIAVEVFYDYQPMLATSVLNAGQVYSFALFRPRFASLETLLP